VGVAERIGNGVTSFVGNVWATGTAAGAKKAEILRLQQTLTDRKATLRGMVSPQIFQRFEARQGALLDSMQFAKEIVRYDNEIERLTTECRIKRENRELVRNAGANPADAIERLDNMRVPLRRMGMDGNPNEDRVRIGIRNRAGVNRMRDYDVCYNCNDPYCDGNCV
jgi:hypothetical protein